LGPKIGRKITFKNPKRGICPLGSIRKDYFEGYQVAGRGGKVKNLILSTSGIAKKHNLAFLLKVAMVEKI